MLQFRGNSCLLYTSKARLVKDGNDLVIFANGPEVYEALKAEEELAKEGISAMVVDLHTIKPVSYTHLGY